MGKRHSQEIRQEVLEKIRNGRKVAEVAREYGINDMTIRTSLQRATEGDSLVRRAWANPH